MDAYDLIIIGGGPAGITAGIYAARQKINTLIVTKSFGGQIIRKSVGIENYPGFDHISSMDLIKRLEEQLSRYEVPVEFGEVADLTMSGGYFFVATEESKFQARSVIVSSGANPRFLNIPGEKEFVGKGVSYCTACDGPVFKNKKVAVIGGGNAGFETAIFMTGYASKVYIIESGPEVRADASNREKAGSTGKIEIITNAAIKQISGEKFVDKMIYRDISGNADRSIAVDGIFFEVGYQPSSGFIKGDLVDFNEKREIKVDFETLETKTPGLFAPGDVNSGKNKQIVIACGQGAKAALSAYTHLQKAEKN
ncbi:MAG: FAD-dependent oxidoreductase [Candidatus Paceibacterota bacterium]|jgi:thioredoxin-disulfide reductase